MKRKTEDIANELRRVGREIAIYGFTNFSQKAYGEILSEIANEIEAKK